MFHSWSGYVGEIMGVREQYLEYLCSKVSCLEIPSPGRIVLRGKEIWSHPHVKIYQEWVLYHWQPEPKPVALLLPCTPTKPYGRSPIRRIIYANLRELDIEFHPYGRLAFRDAKRIALRVFSILNSMHGVAPSRWMTSCL